MKSIRDRKATSGKEVMRAIGIAYVEFAAAHPGWFDVMVRRDLLDKTTPDFAAATESSYGALRQTVETCVREGYVDPAKAQEFAVLCWSVVFGLAALWNSRAIEQRMQGVDIDNLAERVVTLYIDHIMPEEKASAGAPAEPQDA